MVQGSSAQTQNKLGELKLMVSFDLVRQVLSCLAQNKLGELKLIILFDLGCEKLNDVACNISLSALANESFKS